MRLTILQFPNCGWSLYFFFLEKEQLKMSRSWQEVQTISQKKKIHWYNLWNHHWNRLSIGLFWNSWFSNSKYSYKFLLNWIISQWNNNVIDIFFRYHHQYGDCFLLIQFKSCHSQMMKWNDKKISQKLKEFNFPW